jgi:tetratricopeptide (TPR) repeat protein
MKVRCVSFAFVSAAYLAAFAMIGGTAYASSSEDNIALVRKAYVTLQSGDVQAALGEYSDAINSDALEPEMLANALLNRALVYQQLADHKSALADYDAALKLNIMAPALRSTALYNRGLAQQKSGAAVHAIEDFTASLLINPKFAQAFYSRANVLRDSGQLLFALSDYERALQYNHPDKAKVHYGSATTYLALKRPLDAKREFNLALEINPDFGQARAQLVMLGDQNAERQLAESDPILTGSVGAYTGGTDASKITTPKAIDVPAELETTVSSKIEDRLPEPVETPLLATANVSVAKAEDMIDVGQVPDVPTSVAKKTAPAAKLLVVAGTEEIKDENPTAQVGWAVQIASAASEDAAWSTWKKMQASHQILKTKKPNVVKADLGAKGIFYRVRLTGFEEQAAAKSACVKLKAGGVSCYISKVGS